MSNIVIAYIALGSNMNNPQQQVQAGIQALTKLPGTHLEVSSSLYKSSAYGPVKQADFINAVAQVNTKLTATELLSQLQLIEKKYNRQRTLRWGPRTLDLDLLLFGDAIIDSTDLTIPHPEIGKRDFVLQPLLEINPHCCLPNGTSLQNHSDKCTKNNLQRIDIC